MTSSSSAPHDLAGRGSSRPGRDPLRAHPVPGDLRTSAVDFLRPPVTRLFERWWQVEVYGAETLPQGAAIVAPNHQGSIDGPLAVAFTPGSLALGKRELFHGVLGVAMRWVGQIPVNRGQCDVEAMRTCVEVLDSGHRLTIFPEGHRGAGDFSVFHNGVAYLAMVTGAPVVPVALFGTHRIGGEISALPRRGARLAVVYGEPIAVEPVAWPRRKQAVAEVSARLAQACRDNVRRGSALTGLSVAGEEKAS